MSIRSSIEVGIHPYSHQHSHHRELLMESLLVLDDSINDPAMPSTTTDNTEKPMLKPSPTPLKERKSRRKRVAKAEIMKAQVVKLEQFALVVRVLSDPDAIWDEYLDEDTKRQRGALRQLEGTTREAKRLALEKTQLQRLLTEHELARRTIARRMELMKNADDQRVRVQHWQVLAGQWYRPITTEECLETIQRAVSNMAKFESRPDKISTGMSFLGWRDRRLPLTRASRLEFCFDKMYEGFDVDLHIRMMQQIYSDADTYRDITLGRRALVSITLVQRLTATASVMHFTKSYPGVPLTTHHLYLLACLETEDGGAVQFVHPIENDDLQAAIRSPTDVWTTSSYWIRWQVLDHKKPRSSTNYRVWIGGSMRVEDPAYLSRWLLELLGVVVRSELLTTARPLLTFS